MEINKSSWLCKLAYGIEETEEQPDKTTLCAFFWRCVYMFFIGWPWFVLMSIIMILVAGVLGFFTAERPDYNNESGELTVPYKHWPTVEDRGEKVRIYPIWVLAEFVVVYLLTRGIINYPLYALSVVGGIIISALGIGGLTYALTWLCDSQVGSLIKAYLKAKKQKVCPIIRFH